MYDERQILIAVPSFLYRGKRVRAEERYQKSFSAEEDNLIEYKCEISKESEYLDEISNQDKLFAFDQIRDLIDYSILKKHESSHAYLIAEDEEIDYGLMMFREEIAPELIKSGWQIE